MEVKEIELSKLKELKEKSKMLKSPPRCIYIETSFIKEVIDTGIKVA